MINKLIQQIINILQNKNKTLIQQLYNIIYNYFQKKLQEERNKISTIRVPPNGTIVIFDKEDEDKVLPYSWHETSNGYITRGATTYERNNNIPATIGLHRQILNVLDKKEIEVDHINCIKWDNRKKNLRLASSRDNSHNQLLMKSNTSGIKGVSIKKSYDKYYWRASILINDKRMEKWFSYTDEGKYQAQQWYDNMANIKYKEFAKTNIAIQNQYKIINEINLLLTNEDYNKPIHTSIKGQSNYLGVHFSKEKWSNGKYKYH